MFTRKEGTSARVGTLNLWMMWIPKHMLQGEARDKGCQGKTVMPVGDVQQQHGARTINRDIQVKRLTYWLD